MSAGPGSALEREDRWARVALSFLVEPDRASLHRRLVDEGAVGALASLRTDRRDHSGLTVRLVDLDLEALAAQVRRHGLRVLVPDDPDWPPSVDRLEVPPYCLFVAGDVDLGEVAERAVAVVGARAATDYGLGLAADLGAGLADRGWMVVSGAAVGIDAAAHQGALSADGGTVAVLACGLDRAYPAQNARLIARIREHGALVSEVPPGALPLPRRFLARNRVIAALARATVVVEAGLRSGSLSTARDAERLRLPVAAFPGPVTSAVSAGTHALLRDTDAVLVTDTDEVLELAAPIGTALAPLRAGRRDVTDDLSPVVRDVLAAAPVRRWAEPSRLAVLAGVDPAAVPPALAELEMLGLLEVSGGRWRKAPPASPQVDPWAP